MKANYTLDNYLAWGKDTVTVLSLEIQAFGEESREHIRSPFEVGSLCAFMAVYPGMMPFRWKHDVWLREILCLSCM